MKRMAIVVTLISGLLLGMFAAVGAAEVWPDGSALDAWFADRSPVDESKLGKLYRAEEFSAIERRERKMINVGGPGRDLI